MRHTWKQFGFWTLLLGALSAAPSFAGNSDNSAEKGTKADPSVEILKELRALTKRLDNLEKNLETDLRELRSRGTQTDLSVQTTQKDVNDLKSQFEQLRRDLDGLNRRLGPTDRISAYGPSGPAAPATGRVKLVNTYFLPQTIVVNGKAYTVAPYDIVFTDPIPAGAFTYEVLNVQPRQDRTMAVNETYPIYIHPR